MSEEHETTVTVATREQIAHLVTALAEARAALEAIETEELITRNALMATRMGMELTALGERAAAYKAAMADADHALRMAIVRNYEETGEKNPHDAASVKLYDKLLIDDEKRAEIMEWAVETHAFQVLKIDEHALLRIAKVLPTVPGVTVIQEPRATIARDLSKYWKEPVEDNELAKFMEGLSLNELIATKNRANENEDAETFDAAVAEMERRLKGGL